MSFKTVFLFKDIPELISDDKGNFTYKGLPCKKVYNSGATQIRCNKFKFSKGLKTLRKLAYKSQIIKENLPF